MISVCIQSSLAEISLQLFGSKGIVKSTAQRQKAGIWQFLVSGQLTEDLVCAVLVMRDAVVGQVMAH